MVSLDAEQLEQLRVIGAFLNEVREEQGRTLEDVATKTYIPLRLLKAIETGQEQGLPEPVFVQGFIRRYGDALGLDGNDLSSRFPVNRSPVSAPVPEYEPRSESNSSYAVSQSPSWQSELPPSRPPYLLFGAAALAALAGLFFLVIKPNLRSSAPVADAPVRPEPVQPAPSPVAIASPESPEASPSSTAPTTPTTSTTSTVAASPSPASSLSSSSSSSSSSTSSSSTTTGAVAIEMNLTDEAWVQVVVDGVTKYEGTLEKGAKQSWSGKERIVVYSGNAGAVAIAYNQGTAKPMGSLGAVEEKVFTPKGEQ